MDRKLEEIIMEEDFEEKLIELNSAIAREIDFEDRLIKAVRKYECLFNKGAPSYRKKLCKQAAWKNVADDVGSNIKECLHRWRSLRDRFVREMKIKSRAGKDSKFDCKWKYFNKLTFLEPHLRPKNSNSTCVTDEETCSEQTQFATLEYEVDDDYLDEDITASFNTTSEGYETLPDKEEIIQEIAFVSTSRAAASTPRIHKTEPKTKPTLTKAKNHRLETETEITAAEKEENKIRNRDYYKTLDSYMLQLPVRIQDDLKIQFLNHVYNEIQKL